MSIYDEIKATVSVGDLAVLNIAAKCFECSDNKREKAEKRNAELIRICEEQAAEIQQLRTRLSEVREQKPRELSPLLKQRVANAADVLRCMTPVVMSGNGEAPAVEGDRFNSVLKTLHELYNAIVDELPEVMK